MMYRFISVFFAMKDGDDAKTCGFRFRDTFSGKLLFHHPQAKPGPGSPPVGRINFFVAFPRSFPPLESSLKVLSLVSKV